MCVRVCPLHALILPCYFSGFKKQEYFILKSGRPHALNTLQTYCFDWAMEVFMSEPSEQITFTDFTFWQI